MGFQETNVKINLRGRRAYLYRRKWISAGPGVPHGYPAEEYLGAIDVDATEVPAALSALLNEPELAQLHEKVLQPAAETRVQVSAQAERRARDPAWRVQEAARLLVEAAELSERERVLRSDLQQVTRALERVCVLDAHIRAGQPPATRPVDSLAEALAAVKAATVAVREGAYGQAPSEGARGTRPYRLWAELVEAFEGERSSLLRALQAQGFVKSRRR